MRTAERQTIELSRRTVIRIGRRSGDLLSHLSELVAARRLLTLLMRKDIVLRYRDTYLGLAWAVAQPLATVLVFWFAFGVMGKVRTTGSYPLFSLAGLIPFSLMSAAATRAGGSLASNAYLVSRVYFPRLILPLSSTAAPLLDAAIGCGLLLVMMLISQGHIPLQALLAPLALVVSLVLGLGIGLVVAAMSVALRDVRAALPVLLQLLLLATPVAYPADAVPQRLSFLVSLNPAACAVDLFRAAMLGHAVNPGLWVSAAAATLLLWLIGLPWFHAAARSCADKL